MAAKFNSSLQVYSAGANDPPSDLGKSSGLVTTTLYSGPFQKADFGHWAKMLVWNWFEIGCLTCGYEPNLLYDLDEDLAKDACPQAYEAIRKRWDLVQREQFASTGERPMAPLDVMNWLDSIEEAYPTELREVATRIGKKRVSPVMTQLPGHHDRPSKAEGAPEPVERIREDEQPRPALTRKYRSLQKVALAMAMHRYDYDPEAGRSSAPREIMGATELFGLRVTDDTILSQLREAFEEHGADR